MKDNQQPLVLILAGGVGSRLNTLVQNRAKPAVPFGGIYRIIDFSLSNVANSGFGKVGCLTQYQPLSLMSHLGSGEAWDLTGRSRGIKLLPPRTGAKDSDWYQGTADAVRRNIDFLHSNPSKEVLILSGDHIYNMDFEVMLAFHRSKKADVTIAMMVVPKSEMHHFGAGITNSDGRIIDWEEKPKDPKTNLASMGIYVFDREYLLETLSRDKNEIDFGMHILPHAIKNDNVYAYPFYGYWRDVGTIQAYWQTNMDFIHSDRTLVPQKWPIRTNVKEEDRPADRPPAKYGCNASLQNSLVSAGCVIDGTVENSVLSPGVVVKKGAVVQDSIIFSDCVVEEGATVDLAIIDKNVHVGKDAVVGAGKGHKIKNKKYPTHLYSGITVLGKSVKVPANMEIGRNCLVSSCTEESCFPDKKLRAGESLLADGEVC